MQKLGQALHIPLNKKNEERHAEQIPFVHEEQPGLHGRQRPLLDED